MSRRPAVRADPLSPAALGIEVITITRRIVPGTPAAERAGGHKEVTISLPRLRFMSEDKKAGRPTSAAQPRQRRGRYSKFA